MRRAGRFSEFKTPHMEKAVGNYLTLVSNMPERDHPEDYKKQHSLWLKQASGDLQTAASFEAAVNPKFADFLKEHDSSMLSRRHEALVPVEARPGLSTLDHKEVLAEAAKGLRRGLVEKREAARDSDEKAKALLGMVESLRKDLDAANLEASGAREAMEGHRREAREAHEAAERLQRENEVSRRDLEAARAELRAVRDSLGQTLSLQVKSASERVRRDKEVGELRKRLEEIQSELDEMKRIQEEKKKPKRTTTERQVEIPSFLRNPQRQDVFEGAGREKKKKSRRRWWPFGR